MYTPQDTGGEGNFSTATFSWSIECFGEPCSILHHHLEKKNKTSVLGSYIHRTTFFALKRHRKKQYPTFYLERESSIDDSF